MKWFAYKWMEFEIIILNEVSQAPKDKGHMFSVIFVRYVQKINVYIYINSSYQIDR
jgi:hypothetical protein